MDPSGFIAQKHTYLPALTILWSGDDNNDGQTGQRAGILITAASEANGVGGICLGVFLLPRFLPGLV